MYYNNGESRKKGDGMKNYKIGIVGLGAIGERLIKVMQAYERLDIAGVYDISQERTAYIEATYGLKGLAYEAMLEDETIDLIYLAVPPKYHCDMALEIMNHNKHLFCEKPLASTIEEAERMYKRADEIGIIQGMNFPLFYGPAYKKLKELMDQKTYGALKRIELTGTFPDWPRKWQVNNWIDTRDQGGFVREVFTHFIQLTQDYFGRLEVVDTHVQYANGEDKSETDIVAYGRLEDGTPMVFNGLTGVGVQEDLRLVVWCEDAAIDILNWRDLRITTQVGTEVVDLEAYNGTLELFDAFVDALDGKEENLVDFRAGYETTRVVESLLK